jgi:hypothetical protein
LLRSEPQNPTFRRWRADAEVAASLYDRARGMSVPAVKVILGVAAVTVAVAIAMPTTSTISPKDARHDR